jgi:hypothetical protein
MRNLMLIAVLLMLVVSSGCDSPATGATDWTPTIACEGAMVSMAEAPMPEPEPAPDDGAMPGSPITGPLDTFRDAKELIRKGNDLADRSKALLDAAQRDGKITVDIRLPKVDGRSITAEPATPAAPPSIVCGPAGCTLVPSLPPPAVTSSPPPVGCATGVCRPRLLWRRR